MQNLTLLEWEQVNSILIADRQWRRSERIKHAKRNLKLAYRENPEEVPLRKVILRRLEYDYIDKVNAHVE